LKKLNRDFRQRCGLLKRWPRLKATLKRKDLEMMVC